MERLTYTDKDGYDIWDEEGLIKQLNRLAAYEDTGLEPEEIYEVRFLIAAQRDPQKLSRLSDLVLADQEGRLVVLPCKVVCGTTIWWADSNIHADPIKCEVSSFGIYTGPDGELQLWMNCYVYGTTPMSRSFRVSSICKTVFLTREAAEAALKGGEG